MLSAESISGHIDEVKIIMPRNEENTNELSDIDFNDLFEGIVRIYEHIIAKKRRKNKAF